uniref:Integrin, alpha 5 (fibronectin receptor, alpha polypeptide) n=1 Tax=Neogobius melanostomus TaxID=47308 RepID=A0A8C6TFQ8_9GOBI
MGLRLFYVKTPEIVRSAVLRSRSPLLLCIAGLLLLTVSQPVCEAFNLDVENPSVYSGPPGSYFGYAVDFYLADAASASVLIGAPKASTRQVNVIEGGAVYYCPWSASQADCHPIEFDKDGKAARIIIQHQADFKSNQWFGATVRSHGDTILVRRSSMDKGRHPHSDATGTCYLSAQNFTKFVEYAPCRTEISGGQGQGYCQGGFSADFTTDGKVVLGGPGSYFWQGQVISAAKENIFKAYYPGYFVQSVDGQIQTKHVQKQHDKHDDSYQAAVNITTKHVSSLFLWTRVLQMGAYFGYAVATTDINSDGLVDLLVGAPMYMVQGSGGRLEEMGRVYVYIQRAPLTLELSLPHLTGTQVYSRFGNTIAPLGDLNQDGYNDVAISSPFAGDDHLGPPEEPSQVIAGQWASSTFPASFGFSLRGARDLDMNGYPDLLVGAFGVDKAILYRSRPIVNTTASLTVHPGMINPEEKNCVITDGNSSIPVSCVNVSFCLSADGKHLPDVKVQLDSREHKKKASVKRALFLDTQQPRLESSVRVRRGKRTCDHKMIYLRGEKEFRDKLSPIYVSFNYSLDPSAAADSHGLRPVLNYHTANVIEQKAQILLDCGEDNICVPDLKLAVLGDRKEVYLGDDNALTLTFNARNEGEGGAYEAELYVVLPPEADYSGIARNNESRNQLTCSYDTENQTRYLSCELGNPMNVSRPDKVFFPPANWKATKNYGQEQDIGPAVEHIYELVNNGPSRISHTILTLHCPLSVSGQSLLYPVEFFAEGPINCTSDHHMNKHNLKIQRPPTDSPLLALKGNDHRIEKRDVHRNQLSHLTNLSCSNVECWKLQCNVGLLERGTTAILKVRSRVWAETFMEQYVLECLARYSVEKMPYAILPKHAPSGQKKVVTPVVWNKPDIENSVPLWIIILAVLVGLLLLIVCADTLIYRSVPYGTAMEKAELKPQATSEA